jgi:beta-phosphoglucomutase-like phosphatase (HAD superfamily)
MKALIFDLDGTLVDSVYAHVLAWQLAFAEAGIPIDGWRLHRRMGMSGGLFKRAVMRELGRTISMPRLKGLDKRHGELFRQFLPKPPSAARRSRTAAIPAPEQNRPRHRHFQPAPEHKSFPESLGGDQRYRSRGA